MRTGGTVDLTGSGTEERLAQHALHLLMQADGARAPSGTRLSRDLYQRRDLRNTDLATVGAARRGASSTDCISCSTFSGTAVMRTSSGAAMR